MNSNQPFDPDYNKCHKDSCCARNSDKCCETTSGVIAAFVIARGPRGTILPFRGGRHRVDAAAATVPGGRFEPRRRARSAPPGRDRHRPLRHHLLLLRGRGLPAASRLAEAAGGDSGARRGDRTGGPGVNQRGQPRQPRRGYSVETSRSAAAAATRIYQRRPILWRRVAAPPRPRRGSISGDRRTPQVQSEGPVQGTIVASAPVEEPKV